jgi:hypothetical protein
VKLYHGTSADIARKAFEVGLLHRAATCLKSNWDCESSPHLVYLTETYAGFFASVASGKGGSWGIVEVDTDRLGEDNMVPDEDFLEQATRGQKIPGLRARTMLGRTKWFRENIHRFTHHWEDSVRCLGNAAHFGPIPPEAITRVCIFDTSTNKFVSWSCIDPVISLMNHRFMGDKYRALCRWFFDEITPEEIAAVAGNTFAGQSIVNDDTNAALMEHAKNQLTAAQKALSQRSGLAIMKRDA